MKPETLKALEASIAHWECNAKAVTFKAARVGWSHCALCGIFNQHKIRPLMVACIGCPISKGSKRRRQYCKNTPYLAAFKLYKQMAVSGNENYGPRMKAFRKAAQEEVDFLKSLLPEE